MNSQVWLQHVRADKIERAFPRDITATDLKRMEVHSEKEYLSFCSFCNKNNVSGHVSVYSKNEWENKLASCIFLDIDGEDVLDSSSFVNKVIVKIAGLGPMVVYTGGEGFHIFILFPTVKIRNLRDATIFFLNQTLDSLDWEDYVEKDPKYFRPTEVDLLLGDASKAKEQLGWSSTTDLKRLAILMVEADRKILDLQLKGKAEGMYRGI